jgi:hypothetical protein
MAASSATAGRRCQNGSAVGETDLPASTDGRATIVLVSEPEPLRPRMAKWRLQQREEQLYREATKIPTWVLADKSRRFLLDACRQLWERTPTADSYEKLSPREIRRLAVLHLGQIIVRATGAQMMLIATGYEREAFGQVRVTTEAHLRTRQVLDDKSGESAAGCEPHLRWADRRNGRGVRAGGARASRHR